MTSLHAANQQQKQKMDMISRKRPSLFEVVLKSEEVVDRIAGRTW